MRNIDTRKTYYYNSMTAMYVGTQLWIWWFENQPVCQYHMHRRM